MKYEKVAEVNGHIRAEFFKSFLEAEGIDVHLFDESITHTGYGLPLGAVQVFVPKDKVEAARLLLASYEEFQPEDVEDEDAG
jgi:hypothetical protein